MLDLRRRPGVSGVPFGGVGGVASGGAAAAAGRGAGGALPFRRRGVMATAGCSLVEPQPLQPLQPLQPFSVVEAAAASAVPLLLSRGAARASGSIAEPVGMGWLDASVPLPCAAGSMGSVGSAGSAGAAGAVGAAACAAALRRTRNSRYAPVCR